MAKVPGISIRNLLEGAPETALRTLVGQATLGVLSALNPELITRGSLVELAIQSADPLEMLGNRGIRDLLIGLLPLPKAQELADKLTIAGKGTELYRNLIETAAERRAEPILRQFFGIVVSERAPATNHASQKEIRPKYGLFSHQKRVADRVIAALREHPWKTVLHMPTGAGKTRTAMHIVAETLNANPGRLIVWLAQSGELLEQAAEEFEKAWELLGSYPAPLTRFWGQHNPDIENARTGLLVAGFGKLHALSKRDPNMIIRLGDRAVLTVVDEAHQAIAPTYGTIILNIQEKRLGNGLLGLTATPGRTWADIEADSALADFFGGKKITLEVEGFSNPVEYLIQEGFLAKPTFRTLNSQAGLELSKADLQKLGTDQDIPASILESLAVDEQRNIQIITTIESLCQQHQRLIVFAATVEHAHLISSILSIRGTQSFVITGLTDRTTRERVIVRFKGNDPTPMVICNFGVLTTGFDAPKVSAAVIARPTRSLVLFSQMAGRAIRGERAGGNKTAEVVTVVDPALPGFGSIAEAFTNWEDVWNDTDQRH